MKATDLLALLQDLYREKLALRVRHVAGAEQVSGYEFNNTYQFVIDRDDTHLSWIRSAILGLEGEVPASAPPLAVPAGGEPAIFADDARHAQAFVDRWRARSVDMTNARHQAMLKVIIGETLEHKRFFEQAQAGREDLLGRRAPGASTGGGVLSTRWVE